MLLLGDLRITTIMLNCGCVQSSVTRWAASPGPAGHFLHSQVLEIVKRIRKDTSRNEHAQDLCTHRDNISEPTFTTLEVFTGGQHIIEQD